MLHCVSADTIDMESCESGTYESLLCEDMVGEDRWWFLRNIDEDDTSLRKVISGSEETVLAQDTPCDHEESRVYSGNSCDQDTVLILDERESAMVESFCGDHGGSLQLKLI